MKRKFQKIIFLVLGILSTTFGIIGIFLPLLPTTPFLLIAAFFFLKSSKRLYKWLTTHKILGKFIYNYIKYRAITLKSKIFTILLLWISIGISIYLLKSLHFVILLIIIGIGVSIHLVLLKTYNSDIDKSNKYKSSLYTETKFMKNQNQQQLFKPDDGRSVSKFPMKD
jgi:uncharacterized membrane protein YbaN (DUF454 family)